MSDGWGSVVRRARLERSLTQAQLAEISGDKQANISAIETGRREPSAPTLHRLLVACGFDLVAIAGARSLSRDPSGDWPDSTPDLIDPATPGPKIPNEQRARMMVAVLDASEAILRSR